MHNSYDLSRGSFAFQAKPANQRLAALAINQNLSGWR